MKGTFYFTIKSFPDLFVLALSNKEGENFRYIVNSVNDKNHQDDRWKIYDFANQFKGYLVGFDSLNKQEPHLIYIIKNYQDRLAHLTPEEFCREMFVLEQFLNSSYTDVQAQEKIKELKYVDRQWTSMDLYLQWSYKQRTEKKINLISLAIQLGIYNVHQPYYPQNSSFTNKTSKHKELMDYIFHTELPTITAVLQHKREDNVLRFNMQKKLNIDCFSKDEVKIASDYLLDRLYLYKKNKGENISKYDLRSAVSEVKPAKLSIEAVKLIPNVKFETETLTKGVELFLKYLGVENTNIKIQRNDTNLTIKTSLGGIHSENNNSIVKSDRDYVIMEADITSLFPTLLVNYGFIREDLLPIIDITKEILSERLLALENKDDLTATFLKKVLVSIVGLADNQHSWLYSPNHIQALRVMGQLIQLKFIEKLSKEKGIKVFFTNTDGTMALVDRRKQKYFLQCAKEISEEFAVQWKFTTYKKIVFKSINNYISEVQETFEIDNNLNYKNHIPQPYIKSKGLFRYGKELDLGDNIGIPIISKALSNYFVFGIEIEKTINDCVDITDFCASINVSQKYDVFFNKELKQNVNRFYYSNNGGLLERADKNFQSKRSPIVSEKVVLLNELDRILSIKNYNLDKNFYIRSCRKIIAEIEQSSTQTTLF